MDKERKLLALRIGCVLIALIPVSLMLYSAQGFEVEYGSSGASLDNGECFRHGLSTVCYQVLRSPWFETDFPLVWAVVNPDDGMGQWDYFHVIREHEQSLN